jgi:winged helix DNA-binding protein
MQVTVAQARAHVLVKQGLAVPGPAGVDDLKWWTGWTKRDSVAALTALGEEITPVSLDGLESWVLGDEAATLAEVTPEAGRGVRLLPVWDAYFMGYATSPAGRARQVAAQDYPSVYDKAGNGTSTVIVNGMAAGVWELDADGGRVMVAPFGDDLPWDAVGEQIAALGTAVGAELRLERSDVRGPLSDGPRNTSLSPISPRC